MKVLHYSLGLPPFRSGGMTGWSLSLMKWQEQNQQDVCLMFPGSISIVSNKMRIKKLRSKTKFPVYELLNPLPVPIIYGIDSDKKYLDHAEPCDFLSFFNDNDIKIIHLHTLMGLPLVFLTSAKKAGIKIIYTAHDAFGVWPDPRELMGVGEKVEIYGAGYIGNQKILNYKNIVIMQSKIYRYFKNSRIFRIARMQARQIMKIEEESEEEYSRIESNNALKNQDLYLKMRNFYKPYFENIDLIHFGSNLAKMVFERCGVRNESFVAYVYHGNIPKGVQSNDNYKLSSPIKILYAGTQEPYKGYGLLIQSLDKLYVHYPNAFELITYSSHSDTKRSYIHNFEPYSILDISKVYSGADVTIVPSLYLETFGLVAAESLSYGCPVIVSESVGAKELLDGSYGYVFRDEEELIKCLTNIFENGSDLLSKRRAIANSGLKFDSDVIMNSILAKYEFLRGSI